MEEQLPNLKTVLQAQPLYHKPRSSETGLGLEQQVGEIANEGVTVNSFNREVEKKIYYRFSELRFVQMDQLTNQRGDPLSPLDLKQRILDQVLGLIDMSH